MALQDSLLSEMSEAQKEEVAVEMSRVSESDFDLWTAAMKESGEQAKERRRSAQQDVVDLSSEEGDAPAPVGATLAEVIKMGGGRARAKLFVSEAVSERVETGVV